MDAELAAARALPEDHERATLVGRAWLPGEPGGPSVVTVRGGEVYDLTRLAPTMADLINAPDPVALAQDDRAVRVGPLTALLEASHADRVAERVAHLLAPTDLSAHKAAGVTFVKSMLERVVEEATRGDPDAAATARARIEGLIGGNLAAIVPGSEAAAKLKTHLIEAGAWSPYLEVGIGVDAEIFTKAQPMSAVGTGAEIGIHPRSQWNNPEPEVVLVIAADGRIVGATLGNDVNLRDFEGRSALLLGKAKDNNAACAIGPLIRLVDDRFTVDTIRGLVVALEVRGTDGFVLQGSSSMREISRDIENLVGHLMGGTHQYPDGAVLFCGTMFAPVEDRDVPGHGFTHKLGDVVCIATPELGCLVNRINHADKAPPWTFGARQLLHNLHARGLL
ncbi:MAG: fumarylacetoacetate hydrolase family protein [Geminicoccaceae bacterium]